jgi:hypothetical protein
MPGRADDNSKKREGLGQPVLQAPSRTAIKEGSGERQLTVRRWRDELGERRSLGVRGRARPLARLAVEIIADKWAVVVLYGLADKPR